MASKNDQGFSLQNAQKIMRDSMTFNDTLARLSSENLANVESPKYRPKVMFGQTKQVRERPAGSQGHNAYHTVKIKRIRRSKVANRLKFDPHHPMADANGYVEMPSTSPLTELHNIKRALHRKQIALGVYDLARDARIRTIGLMSPR